jgi:hypothetical protein
MKNCTLLAAAHKCFSILEILNRIMDFLDDPICRLPSKFEEAPQHNDLLSAALVCRVWSPPALHLIWRTQSSLIPLFKLLSPDCWEVKVTKTYDRQSIKKLVCLFFHSSNLPCSLIQSDLVAALPTRTSPSHGGPFPVLRFLYKDPKPKSGFS